MTQMERLRPRKLCIAERRQAASAPRVLHANPRELRVEVVASVHEPGSGLDACADLLRVFEIARPDRGREPVGAVVHHCDRLGVILHLHDADRGAEGLLAHDPHRVIDIDEGLRRHVG